MSICHSVTSYFAYLHFVLILDIFIADKATSEDLYNGSSQSRAILAKPRLGGFGSSIFASSSNKTCNPFGKFTL